MATTTEHILAPSWTSGWKTYWTRRWFKLSAWLNTTDWRARAHMETYWTRRWLELSAWLNTTDWRARAHMTYFCETSHWNWKIIMSSVLCSSVVECGTVMQGPEFESTADLFKSEVKIRNVLRCQMRSYDWVMASKKHSVGVQYKIYRTVDDPISENNWSLEQ